ncbi:response regulator [Donghicola eburneus]|jgi:two-component system chemotaxis response regulator CheY|uniref:response regulator n=1 Tax=Donghicola eburneus TaxID=393278 RepID=UPI0008F40579|nr:response regulator [Donghicola eburneus]SFQ75534.1 two-component system, chemotaxis family, response regulator CheY [Donghicola eburneus]
MTMHNTALIIDDATTVRMYHRSLVEQAGWVALEAENGVEALEKALEFEIDLILVDVNMPVMDGYSFIKALRTSETLGQIPVVMISTEAQLVDKDKAFAAGANHYLVKPATPADITTLLTLLAVEGEVH